MNRLRWMTRTGGDPWILRCFLLGAFLLQLSHFCLSVSPFWKRSMQSESLCGLSRSLIVYCTEACSCQVMLFSSQYVSKKSMSHSQAMYVFLRSTLRIWSASVTSGWIMQPWHFLDQWQIEQQIPLMSTCLRTKGLRALFTLSFWSIWSTLVVWFHHRFYLSWTLSCSIDRTLIQTCSYNSRPEDDSVARIGNSVAKVTVLCLLRSLWCWSLNTSFLLMTIMTSSDGGL